MEIQQSDINSEWLDVSVTINTGMAHWPDNVPVSVTKSSTIGIEGAVANVSAITMSVHTGTHVDAPKHFYEKGADMTKTNIDSLIGKAKVFHVIDTDNEITESAIAHLPISKGDRILFRTRNSEIDWETQPFMENYVRLSPDAAKYLVNKEVSCVGVDYLSVAGGEKGSEVHKLLLGVPISVIEGLKLGNIEQGDYNMICLPLKIKDSDGAPSRVILKRISQPQNV